MPERQVADRIEGDGATEAIGLQIILILAGHIMQGRGQ